MKWLIEFCDELACEFDDMPEAVQDELLAQLIMLERFGHALGRPRVDTLNCSKFANLKELRFKADGGIWRVAFAFDPQRKAIVLVAGDKAGKNEKRFYRVLIKSAEERFERHLSGLSMEVGDGEVT